MRIMDYGEPKNDWLDLNSRRVNRPGVHISNNVIIGAVYLDRESSTNLVEKANREGFLENDAYQNLYNALEFCLERIESESSLATKIIYEILPEHPHRVEQKTFLHLSAYPCKFVG